MSFALRAAVLVILQSQPGTWCSLHYLISRVARPTREVEAICHDLVAAGEVQVARVPLPDGSRCFGVSCSASEAAEPIHQSTGSDADAPV